MWYFHPTEGESLDFQICRETLPLPSFFVTACKSKDEKEETIFYFLMVFNLLKIIRPFESNILGPSET